MHFPAGNDICLGLTQEDSKNGLIRVMDKGPLPGLKCCCCACFADFFPTHEDEPLQLTGGLINCAEVVKIVKIVCHSSKRSHKPIVQGRNA